MTNEVEGTVHFCIGAARCGTTWLFNNLLPMPSVFTPIVKEVRYWYGRRSDAQVKEAIANAQTLIERGEGGDGQRIWLDAWSKIGHRDAPSIDQYIDLMNIRNKISIDISPAYCLMPRNQIKEFKSQIPAQSKIAYFVRNPLDRAMSQLKLHFHLHGRFRGTAPEESYLKVIESGSHIRRANYAAVIADWDAEFGERFKVFNYDDLEKDPKLFLKSTCEFFGISVDREDPMKNATQYFGTDRNKGPLPATPKMSHHLKSSVAKILEPLSDRFAEIRPEIGGSWSVNVRTSASQNKPAENNYGLDLDVRELMRMTESLGENCEYGFWQRHHGYEPSSLFRWAITPIDSLINFLEKPVFPYELKNLSPHSAGMVSDAATSFKFHSKLVERKHDGTLRLVSGKEKLSDVYSIEKGKISFLMNKFMQEARQKPAIYVIKKNGGLFEEDVRALMKALHEFNSKHKLLWVEEGVGRDLQDLGEGIIGAEVSAFAPMLQADHYAHDGWTRIMKKLAEMPQVSEMISAMVR